MSRSLNLFILILSTLRQLTIRRSTTPTPASAALRLELAPDGDVVKIRVIDHGPGIEREHLSRLFDRFYRVYTEANGKAQGNGLGLAIAYSIAEAHQGSLTVESEEGDGSTFILALSRS